VPIVVGWIRPTLIVPAAVLGGLSPSELEAVLAHELAHIRRHDYLVNLLQSAVETLLFYHPGVWWTSHVVRVEREHCCDDLAVKACGDAVLYARAMTAIELMRHDPAGSMAMAVTGSALRASAAARRPRAGTPLADGWSRSHGVDGVRRRAPAGPRVPLPSLAGEEMAARQSSAPQPATQSTPPVDEDAARPSLSHPIHRVAAATPPSETYAATIAVDRARSKRHVPRISVRRNDQAAVEQTLANRQGAGGAAQARDAVDAARPDAEIQRQRQTSRVVAQEGMRQALRC
jgi:hypothetical protein